MKNKCSLSALFILLFFPVMALSATNPKWISEIFMTPAVPVDGQSIIFSARLKVKKGPVSDLMVVVRVDGARIFKHTYPYLDQDDEQNVQVICPATSGHHKVKFVIDPANESGDVNTDDNKIEKDFFVALSKSQMAIVTGGNPDLEMTLYANPKSPKVGDTVDITAHVKNIGGLDTKPCKMRLKHGGTFLGPSYPVPLIKPGRHFEVTIEKILDLAGTYYFQAELFECDEPYKRNNSAVLKLVPRAPDLIISKVDRRNYKLYLGKQFTFGFYLKNIGNAESGPFDVDAFFEPCKLIAQGRKWAHVDNLEPGEEILVKIVHSFKCTGYKTLENLIVDLKNEVVELDETNNRLTHFPLFRVY